MHHLGRYRYWQSHHLRNFSIPYSVWGLNLFLAHLAHSSQHVRLQSYLKFVLSQVWVCPFSLHAASVLQMTHVLMHRGGLRGYDMVDEVAVLACLLAAAVHDFEHGGVNNDFLIKTTNELAVTYNDQWGPQLWSQPQTQTRTLTIILILSQGVWLGTWLCRLCSSPFILPFIVVAILQSVSPPGPRPRLKLFWIHNLPYL